MSKSFAQSIVIVILWFVSARVLAAPGPAGPQLQAPAAIAPYAARFGRAKPVVAVVADNGGTELTDFVIPYGVLARSGVAEVMALATGAGPIQMTPATIRIVPQATIAQFDARFPDGADYVIVPKVSNNADPALLAWIVAQHRKGGTLVSICDGALVLANSTLLNGHRATAHWGTEALRAERYPQVNWIRNARYVVDGKFVSSAGISAAMPTSLALVEAIAGRPAAAALAAQLQVADWSSKHDSDAFRSGSMLTGSWLRRTQSIGVPLAPGVDEIAVALTLDAYSRTGRSKAYGLAGTAAPVRSLNGLTFLPEQISGGADRTLPAPGMTPPGLLLDQLLNDIDAAYGPATARWVARNFEYPQLARQP